MTCRICGSLAIENRSEQLCATCARNERKSQRKAIATFNAPDPKPIAPRSESRAKEEAEYLRKAKAWLRGKECALKGHSPCEGRMQVHHTLGRIGDRLLDDNYWLPVCGGHHHYVELHPEEAYRNGWSLLRTVSEPHVI